MTITGSSAINNTLLTRIPGFNALDPELWFTIAEGNFDRLGITNPTQRFFDVIAVIPPHIIREVRDIIMAPADNSSYMRLKYELIKRLCSSQEEQTRQLIENEAIGDDKPSHFLRRLLNLAGSAVPQAMVRSLWIRRLPQNLQPILATQKDKPLTEVADLADVVLSSTNSTPAPQSQTTSTESTSAATDSEGR